MPDPKPFLNLDQEMIEKAIHQYVENLFPTLTCEKVTIITPTATELDSGDITTSAQVVVVPKES